METVPIHPIDLARVKLAVPEASGSAETLVDSEPVLSDLELKALALDLDARRVSFAPSPSDKPSRPAEHLLKGPHVSHEEADPMAGSQPLLADSLSKDGSMSMDELRAALGEITELDTLLQEKQQYLKELERQRKELECSNAQQLAKNNSFVAQTLAEADAVIKSDSIRLDQLVPSDPLVDALQYEPPRPRAFLTQPSDEHSVFGSANVSSDANVDASSSASLAQPERIRVSKSKVQPLDPETERTARMNRLQSKPSLEHLFRVQKLFESNDFISRNKALGPEARYYSALTPQEQDRVNSILATSDDEGENEAGDGDSDVDTSEYSDAVSSHNDKQRPDESCHVELAENKTGVGSRSVGPSAKTAGHNETKDRTKKGEGRRGSSIKSTTSTTSTAYSVEGDDSKRLEEIHRKLTEIVPPDEWQLKLSNWSLPVSGWASPALSTAPSVASSFPSIGASGHVSIASAGTAKTSGTGEGGLEEERRKLREVERELERLKQEEPRPVSKGELENLLLHCLRAEILKNKCQQAHGNAEPVRAESVASAASELL